MAWNVPVTRPATNPEKLTAASASAARPPICDVLGGGGAGGGARVCPSPPSADSPPLPLSASPFGVRIAGERRLDARRSRAERGSVAEAQALEGRARPEKTSGLEGHRNGLFHDRHTWYGVSFNSVVVRSAASRSGGDRPERVTSLGVVARRPDQGVEHVVQRRNRDGRSGAELSQLAGERGVDGRAPRDAARPDQVRQLRDALRERREIREARAPRARRRAASDFGSGRRSRRSSAGRRPAPCARRDRRSWRAHGRW